MKSRYFTKNMTQSTARRAAEELRKIATIVNEVKADHNAALTKLDADAGVTDTNYNALHAVAAADVSID